MLIIGLTGGIGSGKTTVAGKFSALGAPIIDTDEIAHRLTAPGQPALKSIAEYFGPEVFHDDGTLNRAKLGERIFRDTTARQALEAILHPLIWSEVDQQISKLQAPYCLLVVPLLLETNQQQRVDRILVVDTPETMQRTRIQQRDGHGPQSIDAILKAQVDRQTRLAAADDVIHNDGPIDQLDSAIQRLHKKYLDLAEARI